MNTDLQVWAEDMRLLAWLHVHERSRETLLELAAGGFPEGLVMGAGVEAAAMREGLSALAATPDAGVADDDLAADFTAIYLTHACRVSPCESVWRDEDKLAWQGPTFAVREWYARYGLSVGDWRVLSDDHMSYQLEFVAHLLEKNETEAAARFMDAHLLTFLPDFCTQIAERAATSFYSSLATLTLVTVTALRKQLPDVEPELQQTSPAKDFVAPVNFVARETWLSMS